MLYRIDFQHYLTHMIDYFPANELLHFQYLILSAKVQNQGRCTNMAKVNILYPDNDLQVRYAETSNQEAFRKEYWEMLDKKESSESAEVSWSGSTIYKSIIQLVLNHADLIIVCDRSENYIVDALCGYLKKKWALDAIDLNELFKTGHVGDYYVDLNEVHDKAVDIRRAAGVEAVRALESSKEGRLRLLNMMNKKEKLKKLKELGIKVTERDMGNLNELLIDAWVNPEDDE